MSAIVALPLRPLRAEGQCVNLGHETAEGAVHQLVLLDERLPPEGVRAHADLEVVAGTGRVDDLDAGSGKVLLDALADVLGSRHPSACYTLESAQASIAAAESAGAPRASTAPILPQTNAVLPRGDGGQSPAGGLVDARLGGADSRQEQFR